MTPQQRVSRSMAVGFLLTMALSSACSTNPPAGNSDMVEEWKAELMAADRAFNSATAEKGAAGWVSFFSEEGSMIAEGIGEIHGKEAIRSRMEPGLANPSFHLTWDPRRAEVSESGDLGYTVGEFETTMDEEEGPVVLTRGLYVSIWRRQADGSWKVEMDLGNLTETSGEEAS